MSAADDTPSAGRRGPGEVVLSWNLEDGSVASAIFDITTEETHELTNTITEHEVEAGADISDNVRVDLDRFSITGYVSNSPLITNPGVTNAGTFKQIELQIPPAKLKIGLSSAISAGVSALGDAILGAAGAPQLITFRFDDYQDRVRAITAILDEARKRAAPVRITSRPRDYDGMQFASIVITRTPEDGTGASFAIQLKELRTVSTETVQSPKPSEVSGKPRVSAGSKHAQEDDSNVAKKKTSILKNLLANGAASLLGGSTDTL
jgi:hypothetical protein